MSSPKDAEKFLNQEGFNRDEFRESLAQSLTKFARLAPPLPQPSVPPTQMSREIQDVTVEFPPRKGAAQQAEAGTVGGEAPVGGTELTFEIDVSGVVEDVILFGYFP